MINMGQTKCDEINRMMKHSKKYVILYIVIFSKWNDWNVTILGGW